ncbi:hypothetical protein E4U21_000570 [Claviceps maximensis]|nr:hypothetical protein E4U21_000570 [Claviceps maximensis]
MSIRPLPKDAIDRIKSSSAVTSLNEVVCGLLKNSLDAKSCKVTVGLDFSLGNCVIEDDGLGIEPREFEEHGGLGRLHHTSKLPPSPKIHGSHGDFIASVANLSLLTISSRHHDHHDTCSALTIHNGNVLERNIPARRDQHLPTGGHGTRISVRNLFGSMPVRVKQRGLLFSVRAKIEREWDMVVKEIAALLLAWPGEVSVFAREANTQREARIMARNLDVATRSSRLFVQAGLAETEDRGSSWVPVSASSRRVTIKGAISTTPVASRRAQILCLGIRPVQNSFGTNILYEEMNRIFRSSKFGVVDGNDVTGNVKEKSKKGIEKWPMFFLQVHILGAEEMSLAVEDVLGDSHHTLHAIVDLLKVVCYGFLKTHWMGPGQAHKPDMKSKSPLRLRYADQHKSIIELEPKMAQPSLPSRARLAKEDTPKGGSAYSPFESWHRTKVGKAPPLKSAFKAVENHQIDQPAAGRETAATAAPKTHRRLVGENGMLLRKPFDDVEEVQCVSRAEIPGTTADAQTPPSLDVQSESTQPQQWLKDILDSWENPVFEISEPQIPALPQNPVPTERFVEVRGDGRRSRFFSRESDVQFEAISMNLRGRLSRRALDKAEVIGQVDRKFILLQLPLRTSTHEPPSDSSSALVMLDQHAADERCRLEELMSQYFLQASQGVLQPVTELLERPIVFEMSARESDLLRRCHAHFQTWGVAIEYRTNQDVEAQGGVGVVSRLPPSILERCQGDPKLVIELVRKEIWKFEDGTAPLLPTYDAGKSWVSCFHSCPDGILELLYSRACRSAVMFNDELSLDECKQLVYRLSQCAFPFQCAHGRPSMAPVVDIGSGTGRLGQWSEELSTVDKRRWKAWLSVT